MKSESPTTHLNVKAFAQSAGTVSGQDVLSHYERLMQETQGLGADRLLEWSARGQLRVDDSGVEQPWLHLTTAVSLPLICQRCLGPVDTVIRIDRSFRFVAGEAAAEAEDEEAQEDVLALSSGFNLAELIEDEVLMDLPLVPRHETCPTEVKFEAADPGFEAALSEKRNPFATLAHLEKNKSG